MLDIGNWSFGRVVVASISWIGLVLALTALSFYLLVRGQWQSSGSGGIGAVSGGIGVLTVFGVLFGPPIVLLVAWYMLRRA
jgi:hypothetical protein